jgi:hypothetical protein
MTMTEEHQLIVIDNGSHVIKVSIASRFITEAFRIDHSFFLDVCFIYEDSLLF